MCLHLGPSVEFMYFVFTAVVPSVEFMYFVFAFIVPSVEFIYFVFTSIVPSVEFMYFVFSPCQVTVIVDSSDLYCCVLCRACDVCPALHDVSCCVVLHQVVRDGRQWTGAGGGVRQRAARAGETLQRKAGHQGRAAADGPQFEPHSLGGAGPGWKDTGQRRRTATGRPLSGSFARG